MQAGNLAISQFDDNPFAVFVTRDVHREEWGFHSGGECLKLQSFRRNTDFAGFKTLNDNCGAVLNPENSPFFSGWRSDLLCGGHAAKRNELANDEATFKVLVAAANKLIRDSKGVFNFRCVGNKARFEPCMLFGFHEILDNCGI